MIPRTLNPYSGPAMSDSLEEWEGELGVDVLVRDRVVVAPRALETEDVPVPEELDVISIVILTTPFIFPIVVAVGWGIRSGGASC